MTLLPERIYHRHYFTRGAEDNSIYFSPEPDAFTFATEGRYLERYITVKNENLPALARLLEVNLNLHEMYDAAIVKFAGMTCYSFEEELTKNQIPYESFFLERRRR